MVTKNIQYREQVFITRIPQTYTWHTAAKSFFKYTHRMDRIYSHFLAIISCNYNNWIQSKGDTISNLFLGTFTWSDSLIFINMIDTFIGLSQQGRKKHCTHDIKLTREKFFLHINRFLSPIRGDRERGQIETKAQSCFPFTFWPLKTWTHTHINRFTWAYTGAEFYAYGAVIVCPNPSIIDYYSLIRLISYLRNRL